jgi:hypothetical protein
MIAAERRRRQLGRKQLARIQRDKAAAKIMTGELSPARHVPCAATRSGNHDQIHHVVRRW